MLFNHAYPQLEQLFDNLYFSNQAVLLWYKSRKNGLWWSVITFQLIPALSSENVDLLKMTSMECAPANKLTQARCEGVGNFAWREYWMGMSCCLSMRAGMQISHWFPKLHPEEFLCQPGARLKTFLSQPSVILCTGDCHLLGWLVWIPKLMGGFLVNAVKKPCWGITGCQSQFIWNGEITLSKDNQT